MKADGTANSQQAILTGGDMASAKDFTARARETLGQLCAYELAWQQTGVPIDYMNQKQELIATALEAAYREGVEDSATYCKILVRVDDAGGPAMLHAAKEIEKRILALLAKKEPT